jgi:hypothetical protein
MAVGGSSSAWYRSASQLPTGVIYPNYSFSFFARSSSSPAVATQQGVMTMVGQSGVQNPQAQFGWNHPAGAFAQAFAQRRAGGSYDPAQVASFLAANVWHHFCGTFDGSTLTCYANGGLESAVASAAAQDFAAHVSVLAYVLGNGSLDSGQFSTGQVAEAAIWSTALTAAEAKSLSWGFRANRVRRASLVFYSTLCRHLGDHVGRRDFGLQAGSDVFTDHPHTVG